MSQLIKDPDDPRRRPAAAVLQRVQDLIYTAQKPFAAETLAFKAIRLAWEATRLAWYAATDETDGDHLGDVRRALGAVEEHVNPPKRRTPEEIQQRLDDNFFDEEYD